MLQITTDKKWKNFKTRDEVPKKVLNSQFDHLGREEYDGFLLYKGTWHHLSDFMAVGHTDGELKNWDGYLNYSFSNGLLIKVSRDGEQYMVAYYMERSA